MLALQAIGQIWVDWRTMLGPAQYHELIDVELAWRLGGRRFA